MSSVHDLSKKRHVRRSRGPVKEHFVIVNQDWLVPVQSLRQLSSINVENELESIVFPYNESFESHWQLFIEHQSHPPRIRIGLLLLTPRDRCLRADIKLIFLSTHSGQVIKEAIFDNHTFFLAKGKALLSYINEHISPKVFLDIENDLYQDVINGTQQGNVLNTNDCTIMVYVKFINEVEIEPKIKALEFSKCFTVDWKLTKFRQIIEQINQTRAPAGNSRRLLSDRFPFIHTKITEDLKIKKWHLLLKCPQMLSTNKQTPFYITLKSSPLTQPNYGKIEILCKNEHSSLRRYTELIEDLTDNYTIEFYTLDELSANSYQYKQDFNENNERFLTMDYLLFSIQIIQPFQRSDISKRIKHTVEPTIISLNNLGNVQDKRQEKLLKSVINVDKKIKSPVNRENTITTSPDDTRVVKNSVLPTIRVRTNSPTRVRSSSSLQTLPNILEHINRSYQHKENGFNKHASNIPSARTNTTTSSHLTDDFTFLTNLFRSGLHSDITIRNRDRQWNLHKSILSARSIYFNQYFATSKSSELNLSDDNETSSSMVLDKIFLFLYTNQYMENPSQKRHLSRLLLESAIKYGIDTLVLLCLQDMCDAQNLNIKTAADLLIAFHQAMNGQYGKYHSSDYLLQIKNFKQIVLRFIQLHSREVLLSSQWKLLEKHYPFLVHDVLEFVVFEKISE